MAFPIEEPTVGEMVRSMGYQVADIRATVARIEAAGATYVTQEQRQADQALRDVREEQQNARIAQLETDRTSTVRWWTTAVGAPALVGLVLWIGSEVAR